LPTYQRLPSDLFSSVYRRALVVVAAAVVYMVAEAEVLGE